MRWHFVVVLGLLVTLAGCDTVLGLEPRPTPACTTDDECTDGLKEGTCTCGQCSYRDAECPVTGNRWSMKSGGALSNACVPAIEQVDARVSHTCATMTDGTGWCWGSNTSGQLGTGTMAPGASFPLQVRSSAGVLRDLVEIRVGASSSCAIRTDRTVVCWGGNSFGELGAGLPPGTGSLDPVVVSTASGPLTNVIALSIGYFHACAVTGPSAGGPHPVYCWGNNSKGQLGDGTSGPGADRNLAVLANVPGVVRTIAVGGEHTCAVTIIPPATEGRTYCWGASGSGRLGNNSTGGGAVPLPQQVVTTSGTPFSAAIVLAAGNRFTCAIKNPEFDFFCWGANDEGELGNGSMTSALVATRTVGTSGEQRDLLATGDHHTCGAIVNNVACWGSDSHGQLGNGPESTTNQLTPQIVIPSNPHRSLTAGHEHTCAVDSARQLRCWGGNSFGQLGTGELAAQLSPTEIPQSAFCPTP